MPIDKSDEQPEKADPSMREILELGSKVTVERDRHPRKQFSQTARASGGMQIDESDEHPENAERPMNASREPD
jgi:hypothetical protein